MAGRVLAGRDLGAGLIELGVDFVRQFKLVLEIIVDPFANLFDLLAREIWNRLLNFFDRAHGQNLARTAASEKRKPALCKAWRKAPGQIQADGSCGCTHDRGWFAIPGAVKEKVASGKYRSAEECGCRLRFATT